MRKPRSYRRCAVCDRIIVASNPGTLTTYTHTDGTICVDDRTKPKPYQLTDKRRKENR